MLNGKENGAGHTQFGNYELIRPLGKGGMGVVYLAIDLALEREVALKLLREELRSQAHLVTRFQREARAAASLSHHNIVHIHSVGIVGDTPYIAMDYVKGRPLSQVLQEEGRMDWKRALAIGEQVADALVCAFEAKIVHRDIKPANILIDEGDHAYVTDFGVAKILTADTQLTVDGTRIGTPHYMSPERCRNEEITLSSDIYSLGVVLFQLMTARLPYEAQNSVDLINKIIFAPPARLSDFVQGIPEDVERLVAYLIEKRPQDRPATPRIAREAIARVRAGRPLDETESSLSEALEAFRHTMDTSGAAKATADEGQSCTLKALAKRIWTRWWDLPVWVQAVAWISAAAFVAFTTMAGIITTSAHDRRYPASSFQGRPESWTSQGNLAQFYSDSPTTKFASLQMLDFNVQPVGWLGSQRLLVAMQGNSASKWDGYEAMALLEPDTAQGTWVFAPTPHGGGGGMPVVDMLAIAPNESLLFRIVNPRERVAMLTLAPCAPDKSRFPQVLARNSALGPYAPIDPAKIAAASVRSDGRQIACALSLPTGQSILTEWALDGPDAPLTRPGPAIRSVHYSPDGTAIAFLEEGKSGRSSLRGIASGDAKGQVRTIAEGNILAMPASPFSPDGRSVAYCQDDGNVYAAPVDASSAPFLLGGGRAAAWHPSGAYLVVAAPDSNNTMQIWAVEAAPQYRRIQITSLDAGVLPRVFVSPDGAWACARVPGSTKSWIVFADLRNVAFP